MTLPTTVASTGAPGGRARTAGRAASVLVSVVALLLAACSGAKTTSTPPVSSTGGTDVVDGAQVLDLVGTRDLQFAPRTLTAGTGRITISLRVEPGSATHNFVIEGVSGARTGFATPDRPETATFTIDKPGSYTFVCTIHRDMVGTLIVS